MIKLIISNVVNCATGEVLLTSTKECHVDRNEFHVEKSTEWLHRQLDVFFNMLPQLGDDMSEFSVRVTRPNFQCKQLELF